LQERGGWVSKVGLGRKGRFHEFGGFVLDSIHVL
jgi:hypothetical protein